MSYKQIDERFWKDKKVKTLSKDGYLFFLYLLTSPHTHYTGLFEMDLDYVNIDTPLDVKESKSAFKELMSVGIIQYDAENNLLWIVNMHKYQVRSDRQIKGAENHIKTLPKSNLCKVLSDTLSIPYLYPWHTHAIQAKAKAKAKAKAEVKEDIKVNEKKTYSDGFEEFWKIYPKKTDKKKGAAKYEKVIADNEVDHITLIKAVKEYAKCKKVIEGYIKGIEVWFNGANWEDEYETVKPDPNKKIYIEHYGWMTQAEIEKEEALQEEIEQKLIEKGELDTNGNAINSEW